MDIAFGMLEQPDVGFYLRAIVKLLVADMETLRSTTLNNTP